MVEQIKDNIGKYYRELVIDLMDHSVNDLKKNITKVELDLSQIQNEKKNLENEEMELSRLYNEYFKIPRETIQKEYSEFCENRSKITSIEEKVRFKAEYTYPTNKNYNIYSKYAITS